VQAGLACAKAQGKHVGRLRMPTHKEAAIRHDLLAGRSLRTTIKAHGVGSKTVQRIKAQLPIKPVYDPGGTRNDVRLPPHSVIGVSTHLPSPLQFI
jgi:hypothetical protein